MMDIRKKVLQPSSDVELSPLDQIRQTEAEVTRAVAAACQAAEEIVAQAQREAAQIKQEAKQSGVRQGQARFRETISNAEEEVRDIVTEAKERANALRRKGQKRMDRGVRQAVRMVIGLGEEGTSR
ncbi:MAG: V-type ATPase subunit subunit G family protein [Anaerolineales bacterium]|jgi:flagellar biosynthesis/type III secretory pathway protein FliH